MLNFTEGESPMTASNEKIFPAGIARGESFCNRQTERQILRENILANEHTVLVSPRRYGKTSLALKVIEENKFHYSAIDLLLATSHEFVKNTILNGVSNVLRQILPKHKQAKQKILSLFSNLNPKFTLSAMGQSVEFYSPAPPKKSIAEALINLDTLAESVNAHAVILLDEFQQIGMLDDHEALEATIRHAAERSKHVTYLFSGSNRHLLEQMFSDRGRPLYHLCDLLRLDRIHSENYINFIQKAAKKQWGHTLQNEVIQETLTLTENHAYYLNLLCRKLWKFSIPPTIHQTREIWQHYITEQYPWIVHDLSALTANQRLVLAGLAYAPTHEPQGQKFSQLIGLTPSNIKRALDALLRNDFVYCDKNKIYRTLDPAISAYLRNVRFFNFQTKD